MAKVINIYIVNGRQTKWIANQPISCLPILGDAIGGLFYSIHKRKAEDTIEQLTRALSDILNNYHQYCHSFTPTTVKSTCNFLYQILMGCVDSPSGIIHLDS